MPPPLEFVVGGHLPFLGSLFNSANIHTVSTLCRLWETLAIPSNERCHLQRGKGHLEGAGRSAMAGFSTWEESSEKARPVVCRGLGVSG